jgi:hypothetical protein
MSTSSRIARIAAVAGIGALGALVPLSTAGAYPNPPGPPEVSPANQSQSPTDVSANTAANNAAKSSTLPFTGGDVAELAAIGGAAAGVGFVLVRRSRRVSTTS